ncbi:MAG: M23 family metallopeptidase, partial [Kiritimatiellia bacterium]
RATFHEGVDIAPVKKDSRGRALDPVYAISDGEVAYVNRVAGNSSYGIYVVLKHQDEVGPVYSLYAHLASVPSQIQAGKKLAMGDEIAVMGHTSTIGIPVQRSHLHLELCMMLNPSFDKWYRKQKLKPDHGRYHGFNFAGLNPKKLLIPLSGKEQIPFSFQQTLQETEPAWQLLLRTTKRPRYFSMYPQLWQGSPYRGRAMLLSVSESGIPLSGRNADEEEIRKLGSSDSLVSSVNEAVLGRNGTRHILKNRGQWILGANGKRWLEILIYDAE